jgi:group II intron reverse transcriptase/maturase
LKNRRLEENLVELEARFKNGSYRAPAVRRVHIPKGDGKSTRPIGIPTVEDKILQRAVAMVLEAIYEQDFLECSYGFRPGRSAHQALERLREGLMGMGGAVVIDVDVKSYFDTIDHGHLRSFLDKRVRDGVIRRQIDKWLKAGVMDGREVIYPQAGTPQGGVISPLLANVFLHEVLDVWFENEVKPRLKGAAFLVRYADDFVIACANEQDANRIMEVLPKRFGKYGLTVHPDKTRVVHYKRPRESDEEGGGSFDFLGFTHLWERSRKGRWVVKRKTARTRMTRAIRAVSTWCKKHRHRSIKLQHAAMSRKLKGHFGYYGITGNSRALARFRHEAIRSWRKWLDRRGQRKSMPWSRFSRMLERYPLPPARAVHSIYRHAASP